MYRAHCCYSPTFTHTLLLYNREPLLRPLIVLISPSALLFALCVCGAQNPSGGVAKGPEAFVRSHAVLRVDILDRMRCFICTMIKGPCPFVLLSYIRVLLCTLVVKKKSVEQSFSPIGATQRTKPDGVSGPSFLDSSQNLNCCCIHCRVLQLDALTEL